MNLRIPALDFSQSAASGVQIIKTIARQGYLICRKAIESLQSTLTSERRGISESESHWPNLRASAISKIFASIINVFSESTRLEKDKKSYKRSFEFPRSNEPVPASIMWLSWLRNVLFILAILLWIFAALMG
jgi:hypothetical protein